MALNQSVSTQKEAIENVARAQVLRDELLPGIVNDVALDVIAPKLPFADLLVLYEAHPVWRQAIQGHLVYKARVRSDATATLYLVVFNKFHILEFRGLREADRREHALYLCSEVCHPTDSCLNEYTWHYLPPTPSHRGGIVLHHQCPWESLNFAICVMGETTGVLDDSCTEIHMLDLAGLRSTWTQCASMQQARLNSAVGVMHGKIFAFGGISGGRYIRGCEVYDPKVDAWSEIEPMISLGWRLKVCQVGNELFVYGCYVAVDHSNKAAQDQVNALDGDNEAENDVIDPDETSNEDADDESPFLHMLENDLRDFSVMDYYLCYRKKYILHDMKDADFMEAYDPVKDKWRVIKNRKQRYADRKVLYEKGELEYCFANFVMAEPHFLEPHSLWGKKIDSKWRSAEGWRIDL